MKISIIIPTLNEEGNIIPLIEELIKYVNNNLFEIIVVDDNSQDQTRKRIRDLAHPKVKLIHRKDNFGFTNSIKDGLAMAGGDWVAWLDGDFSHPPNLFPRMIKKIEDNNLDGLIASRFVKGSEDQNKGQSPLLYFHKCLSLLLSYLCRIFISFKVTDYSSGYILVKRDILPKELKGDYGEYFIFLLGYLITKKHQIEEIDYISPPRRSGESKTATKWSDLWFKGYKYLFMILMVFYLKINWRNNE